MTLALSLKTPEEIRVHEITAYWEKLRDRSPHDCYAMYRSPNRDLWAWVDEASGVVALMWSVRTGQVYQENQEALYPFVSKIGGWI